MKVAGLQDEGGKPEESVNQDNNTNSVEWGGSTEEPMELGSNGEVLVQPVASPDHMEQQKKEVGGGGEPVEQGSAGGEPLNGNSSMRTASEAAGAGEGSEEQSARSTEQTGKMEVLEGEIDQAVQSSAQDGGEKPQDYPEAAVSPTMPTLQMVDTQRAVGEQVGLAAGDSQEQMMTDLMEPLDDSVVSELMQSLDDPENREMPTIGEPSVTDLLAGMSSEQTGGDFGCSDAVLEIAKLAHNLSPAATSEISCGGERTSSDETRGESTAETQEEEAADVKDIDFVDNTQSAETGELHTLLSYSHRAVICSRVQQHEPQVLHTV